MKTLTLSPIDLVLRVARSRVGASEVPPNSNAGPFVEPLLKKVGLAKGDPWCAADVYDIGTIAFDGTTLVWPLPRTGGCAILGEYAAKHNVLVSTPEVGDVFLLWEKVEGVYRFAHTGFVRSIVDAATKTCGTTEGNTNSAASREGWLHAEKTRVFKPEDRFIRWVNLL